MRLPAAGASVPLKLGAGCGSAVPVLADAASWRQEPDGTAVLADVSGHAVLRLAIADGAAWETYQPGTPMVSLIADR